MTVHSGAEVAHDADLGDGTIVWPLAQIRERARLGADCIIGRGAYVGTGVVMGDNCKVQNYALVYEPAVLEDGVFIGPAVVLTNDFYPRSITPEGVLKRGADWEPVGVTVRHGASIGARAVCVAPVTIGRWALVAAGAVVTNDVADFSLVAGVPARHIRWVGKAGVPLQKDASGGWTRPLGMSRGVCGPAHWSCTRRLSRWAPPAPGGSPCSSRSPVSGRASISTWSSPPNGC